MSFSILLRINLTSNPIISSWEISPRLFSCFLLPKLYSEHPYFIFGHTIFILHRIRINILKCKFQHTLLFKKKIFQKKKKDHFSIALIKQLHACMLSSVLFNSLWPGSSVHGILQARILEWVAIPFPWRSSQPRDQTGHSMSPALAGRFFTTSTTGKAPKNNRFPVNTNKIFLNKIEKT